MPAIYRSDKAFLIEGFNVNLNFIKLNSGAGSFLT